MAAGHGQLESLGWGGVSKRLTEGQPGGHWVATVTVCVPYNKGKHLAWDFILTLAGYLPFIHPNSN